MISFSRWVPDYLSGYGKRPRAEMGTTLVTDVSSAIRTLGSETGFADHKLTYGPPHFLCGPQAHANSKPLAAGAGTRSWGGQNGGSSVYNNVCHSESGQWGEPPAMDTGAPMPAVYSDETGLTCAYVFGATHLPIEVHCDSAF